MTVLNLVVSVACKVGCSLLLANLSTARQQELIALMGAVLLVGESITAALELF